MRLSNLLVAEKSINHSILYNNVVYKKTRRRAVSVGYKTRGDNRVHFRDNKARTAGFLNVF